MSALVLPHLHRSDYSSRPKVQMDEPQPAFACRAVSLAEVAEGECEQYLMPGDGGYQQGLALYCGNPLVEGSRKFCAGHLQRLKATNGKGVIGRFTDLMEGGLSRLRTEA